LQHPSLQEILEAVTVSYSEPSFTRYLLLLALECFQFSMLLDSLFVMETRPLMPLMLTSRLACIFKILQFLDEYSKVIKAVITFFMLSYPAPGSSFLPVYLFLFCHIRIIKIKHKNRNNMYKIICHP